MFIKNWEATPVKNTKKVKMICSNCNNETEHEVFAEPFGPSIGFIFAKKPWLSFKHYYLVCPICKNGTKKLTKEQMNALKI